LLERKGNIQDSLRRNWEKMILAAILLLAAYLTCFEIWNEGYGNEFYTAAVKSMTMSWHNFFFASLDPGGFITVDKPAPGLWIQCLFALIFGVHGWSVILPEALCSVGSVAVLYHIVKRSFGGLAGLLAALFLALTPIFIAASRSNNLDAALVLICLLAVWAVLVAAEKGSLKHIILAMALIGVGFNIKTLQAFLFLPAVYLVYFFAAEAPFKKRILHLLLATAVLIVISLSWVVAVDLIPANERPYVGSSTTNSELQLAIGYNGLERIMPASSGNRVSNPENSATASQSTVSSLIGVNSGIPDEGGQAGVLRLYNEQMAGQISWMIILALFGMLALVLKLFRKQNEDRKPVLRQLLCWAGLFVPMCVVFSITGHFHRYYMIMFAPCIAALSAIGVVELWKLYRQEDLKGFYRGYHFLLPVAITLTALSQIYIVSSYSGYSQIFIPIICVGAGLSCIGLILCKILRNGHKNIAKLAAAAGIIGLLAAPAFWSLTPIIYGSNASIPVAGPEGTTEMHGGTISRANQTGKESKKWQQNENFKGQVEGAQNGVPENQPTMPGDTQQGSGEAPGNDGQNGNMGGSAKNFGNQGNEDMQNRIGLGFSAMGGGMQADGMGGSMSTETVKYMMSKYSGERYLVAVPNAGSAESIIINYGVGVMAIGGFRGSDNAISLKDFISLVKEGELRYYWAAGNSNSEISKWVEENGRQVTKEEITGESDTTSANSNSTDYLYDLSALKTTN